MGGLVDRTDRDVDAPGIRIAEGQRPAAGPTAASSDDSGRTDGQSPTVGNHDVIVRTCRERRDRSADRLAGGQWREGPA